MKDDERDGADVALIHGRTADGEGLRILRKREDRIEVGAVHPLKQGAPIVGEVVSLRPRPEFPLLCDVKTEFLAPGAENAQSASKTKPEAPAETRARSGPAQVATDRYRENWDRIWKKKTEPKLVN